MPNEIPSHVSAAWLEAAGCCQSSVDLFQMIWPNGAELTRENILEALVHRLEVDWLASHCLPGRFGEYMSRLDPEFDKFMAACKTTLTLAPSERAYDRAKANVLGDMLGLPPFKECL